jgi:glycosyltransferase involved in cell wall biosynthesis
MPKEKITILIPIRNEESTIRKLIKSLNSQKNNGYDYEFIFIEGNSNDKTLEILKTQLKKFKYEFKIIINKSGTTPKSLNKGILNSNGSYIVRMDCHSIYPSNYISKLITNHKKYDCDNVGGIIKTIPNNKSIKAIAISCAMSSKFCVGPSKFRTSEKSKSKNILFVDTVPFGCFKKSIFKTVGLFNENLPRNQDDEFNSRILNQGGKIILDKQLIIEYIGRENFVKLFNMFFQYGFYKPIAAISTRKIYTYRQIFPILSLFCIVCLFTLSISNFVPKVILLIIFLLYLVLSIKFGIKKISKNSNILINQKKLVFLYYFFIASLSIHLSYAIGYAWGMAKSILKLKIKKDISITR